MHLSRLLFLAALTLFGFGACAKNLPLEDIRLPPGFRIEVWARVDNARAMTLGENRTLFVGSMGTGRVVAVKFDESMQAGRQYVVASGLTMPVGVAFRNGALYVSAVNRILRLDGIESRLDDPPKPAVVTDSFPTDTAHGWKFIAFGPDGKLYVPVGAPCNICEPDPDRYANITRMNPDGTQREVFARGVRNSVGFDWDPKTGTLWFTDNGRDWLGDDAPPCELNHAPRAGMHFGYPYCHGGTIADPEFGAKRPCGDFVAPALNLGPHMAPLGMRFYTGNMFPAAYRGAIFIAEHGSWNRSKKIGYRVVAVHVDGDRATREDVFAEGWLKDESAWGRPADVQMLPDGSLLVSDDRAGAIYRITYPGRQP
jgi:glucose/arabinose dehydrogenase